MFGTNAHFACLVSLASENRERQLSFSIIVRKVHFIPRRCSLSSVSISCLQLWAFSDKMRCYLDKVAAVEPGGARAAATGLPRDRLGPLHVAPPARRRVASLLPPVGHPALHPEQGASFPELGFRVRLSVVACPHHPPIVEPSPADDSAIVLRLL